MEPSDVPHSAIYFGDARDQWWNADYLELVARRIGLSQCHSMLDAGCGYGHWTRAWLGLLRAGTEVTCLDPEAASLSEAARRNADFVAARGCDVTLDYRQGRLESLPFADASFDLVTVQTVLIHVADVGGAIAELHRVVRPGGVVLLAEPNNLANAVADLVHGPTLDRDLLMKLLDLEVRIQNGKQAVGEGHPSTGAFLGQWLDARRFSKVASWLCDRPSPLLPPYDDPQSAADVRDLEGFWARGWHGRPSTDARRWYLAGGGCEEQFEASWALSLAHDRHRLDAIAAGTYAHAGGQVLHLFAAWKRPQPESAAGSFEPAGG